jgi:MOSC domain-containing protein YiiM
LRIGSAGGDADEESSVVLEIASYCEPCATIRDSFAALKFKRIDQELHPGESRVYARVLREGIVKMGDICCLDAREASHFMQG